MFRMLLACRFDLSPSRLWRFAVVYMLVHVLGTMLTSGVAYVGCLSVRFWTFCRDVGVPSGSRQARKASAGLIGERPLSLHKPPAHPHLDGCLCQGYCSKCFSKLLIWKKCFWRYTLGATPIALWRFDESRMIVNVHIETTCLHAHGASVLELA